MKISKVLGTIILEMVVIYGETFSTGLVKVKGFDKIKDEVVPFFTPNRYKGASNLYDLHLYNPDQV